MVGYTFIGVFSGSAPSKKNTPSGEPALWNVYLKNGEKNYLIQKLDEDNIVTKEQYQISAIYFGINFRQVKNPNAKIEVNRDIKNLINTQEVTPELSPEKANEAYTNLIKQIQQEQQVTSLKKQIIQPEQQNIPEQQNVFVSQQSSKKKNVTSPKDYKINLNSKYYGKEEKFSSSHNQKTHDNKFAFSISAPSTITPPKNYKNIQNDIEETDQNPFDDKYSPEKHSLKAVLKKVEKAQRENIHKKLLPIKTSQTRSPINNQFQTVTNNSLSENDEPFAITLEDVITEAESTNPAVNDAIQVVPNNVTKKEYNLIDKDLLKQLGDEELLYTKGNRSTNNLSDKAKRLDNIIRGEFQQSLNHWNSLKRNLAMKQFHNIINKDASFVPAHKHMFTDFAIQLRKLNLHDLALSAAIRCTRLSPDDSHAFFNVSRIYFELNRFDQANEFITKSLELEPDLAPALKLSAIIKECIRRRARNR